MPQRKTPGATEYTLSLAFLCYANVKSFRNEKKGPTRQGSGTAGGADVPVCLQNDGVRRSAGVRYGGLFPNKEDWEKFVTSR